jgi:hypothetical protein
VTRAAAAIALAGFACSINYIMVGLWSLVLPAALRLLALAIGLVAKLDTRP